jgi:predicted aspartyl protease
MTLKLIPQGELKMGLTPVKVKIGDFGSDNLYDADFVVDTGAMDSMAPASELRRVGIKPVGKRLYELASGEVQEYEYGHAKLWFLKQIIPLSIIFGPENCKPILGVIALQTAGYIVDQKNQVIGKLRARPLKQVA